MQIHPHLHLGDMKVKLEIPAKPTMAPSRSLPRSASELADPPSPFSSNPAHHPVSMPTTPAGASASFGCIAARPTTDSPPSTPSRARSSSSKPTTPAAAAAAAYYASLWSPRRLMQRAARAFRSSRSRRVFRAANKDAGEERVSSPTSRVSDEASAVSVVGAGGATDIDGGDGHGDGAGIVQQQEKEERHDHPEVVPEKIIHEMNHNAAPVVVTEEDDECGTKTTPVEEKETTPASAAAATVEEDVESPKKGAAALMTLEPAPEAAVTAAAEEVADKFVAVVKEAIRKHEEEQGEKKGASGKFQRLGSRVKTALEARAESEQPRRREVTRSNDVIEEARSKLLEKRQYSRVRALVGAFETVMEEAAAAAAAGSPRYGTPRHGSRKSA